MIAVVAMHEDQADGTLAGAELVLDAAAHSELRIEALRSIDVALANDAMAESAGAGLETPVHRAPGMERLAELSQRAVKNLDWIAVGVIELEDFEHSTLVGFVVGTDAELYSRLGQLTLHLREFVGASDAEAEVCQVVAAVGMQHEPMMQVVHPQVASIGLAFIGQLEADDASREIFPRVEIFHPDSHVAQLCYLDHLFFLRAFIERQCEPNRNRARPAAPNQYRSADDQLYARAQGLRQPCSTGVRGR